VAGQTIFDAALLAERFRVRMLPVPHRVFAVTAWRPAD
jgi:hypothetical protein